MRRGQLVLGLALVGAAGLLAAWLSIGDETRGDASSLSRGPGGWLAARRYLEERGAAVRLLDDEGLGAGSEVVVSVFPWRSRFALEWAQDLKRHVESGGRAVLAYDGRRSLGAQEEVLGGLGLSASPEPLPPLGWRSFAAWFEAPWTLEPEAGGDRAPVRLRAPRNVVEAPHEARVLYRDATGRGVVFELPLEAGAVLVLPADVLSNGRVGGAGNADLLELLRVWGGDRWAFDEYHHGLRRPVGERGRQSRRAVDLFLIHLGLLYLLALWALAPRLGAPWRPEPVVLGTADSFLLGLGARHDQLGHHAAAARLLAERARELDERIDLPGEALAPVEDARGLVRVAQSVGRAQARARRWK